jgi:hypothetical protein
VVGVDAIRRATLRHAPGEASLVCGRSDRTRRVARSTVAPV